MKLGIYMVQLAMHNILLIYKAEASASTAVAPSAFPEVCYWMPSSQILQLCVPVEREVDIIYSGRLGATLFHR